MITRMLRACATLTEHLNLALRIHIRLLTPACNSFSRRPNTLLPKDIHIHKHVRSKVHACKHVHVHAQAHTHTLPKKLKVNLSPLLLKSFDHCEGRVL